MKKQFCSLLMIAALLAGCSSRPSSSSRQTESPAAHLTPTSWPLTATVAVAASTSTPKPMFTLLPPTVTLTNEPSATLPPALTNTPSITPMSEPTSSPSLALTGTLTIPPSARLKSNCLAVNENLPAQAIVKGVILLQGWEGNSSYRLNVENGEQTPISNASEMVVSPDGSKLAYIDTAQLPDELLVIADANGQSQKTMPWQWEEGWFEIAQWLDNEQLVLTKRGDPFYSLLILNPFTEKQKEIITAYPYIVDYPEPLWGSYMFTRAIYDPTLTRVLYPFYHPHKAGPGIALWDMQTNQAIGYFTISRDYYGQIPKWSPDGQQMAIVVDEVDASNPFFMANELYTISQYGRVRHLTYLSNQHPEVTIGEYSWSPDGRYIAFWLWRMEAESRAPIGEALAILNVETLEVTDYCIPGRLKLEGGGWGAHAPVWSPDGQQLVVESIDLEKQITAILVDLERGYAARIAEGLTPVGWMMSP
jgi:hypothetical protein